MTAPQHPGQPTSGPYPPGPSHGAPATRGFSQWPDAPPDETGNYPQLPDPSGAPSSGGTLSGAGSPVRRHAAADDTGELPAVRTHSGQAELAPAVGQRYSPTGEFPLVGDHGHPAAAPSPGQSPTTAHDHGFSPASAQARAALSGPGFGTSPAPAHATAAPDLGLGAPPAQAHATPPGNGFIAPGGTGTAPPSGTSFTAPSSTSFTPPSTTSFTAPSSTSFTPPSSTSFTAPSATSFTAPPGTSFTPPSGTGLAESAGTGFAEVSAQGSAAQGRGPLGVPPQTRAGQVQAGLTGAGHASPGYGGSGAYANGGGQVVRAAGVAAPPSGDEIAAVGELVRRLTYQIESVILGKPHVVRLALTALLAEGHILLEDVPGVGKTTLARSIAASVQGQWRRIQFTPDLLPSDVTGVTIFNQGTRGFEFHPGPVFANIVIADEINRASPKTQSALLEVMEERNVTVDGVRHGVPRPFLVVATQNPIEMDGTYRLPEAQLDRFLVKLTVGYPSEAVEIEVLRGAAAGRSPDSIDPVTDTATIAQVVRLAHRVHVADPLYAYAVRLGAATRVHPQVRVGVSPRGVIALTRAACAFALTDGRAYVVPEDLKALVEPVFAHRLLLSPDAQVRAVTAGDILREVLDAVAVPAPA